MLHPYVLGAVLILGSTVCVTVGNLVPLANWNKYFTANSFLTVRNISVKQCFLECEFRNLCKAANYWRRRKECELIESDNVTQLVLVDALQACVSITKSDMPEIYACSSCGDETVCDPNNNACVIKECPNFTVNNGSVIGNRPHIGSRQKIQCDDQYQLEPLDARPFCQTNGTWDVLPQCVPVPIANCSEPVPMDHADLDEGCTLEGAVRNYTCLNNYITSTGSTIISVICTSTGNWTTPTETCLRNCGEPPALAKASVSSGNIYEGSVRTYQCETGYYIKTNDDVTMETAEDVTCNASGMWDGLFECVLACGAAPSVDNAIVLLTTGDRTPGTAVTYGCEHGYEAPNNMNNFIVTCQSNGIWTSVAFQCKKDCYEPMAMSNATLGTGGTLEGTVRNYICLNNYITRAGSNIFSVTCTSAGYWTTPSDNCLTSCGQPPAVTDASVLSGSVHEGSVRTYTCQPGHYITKNGAFTSEDNKICNADGVWDGNFNCDVVCAEPVALVTGPNGISDAQITASSYYETLNPEYGRLDHIYTWAASENTKHEYIQFDFLSPKIVNEIITQGYPYEFEPWEWVKTYEILSSTDCTSFTEYGQVFQGNTDATNYASNYISPPILARCVRVNAKTWHDWIAMRAELMGCPNN